MRKKTLSVRQPGGKHDFAALVAVVAKEANQLGLVKEEIKQAKVGQGTIAPYLTITFYYEPITGD